MKVGCTGTEGDIRLDAADVHEAILDFIKKKRAERSELDQEWFPAEGAAISVFVSTNLVPNCEEAPDLVRLDPDNRLVPHREETYGDIVVEVSWPLP